MAGREVLGAVFGVLVGCSSETTVVVPNCGPGTVAKDGVCVPGSDGSLDFGTPDVAATDGGADSSIPPDATTDSTPTDSGAETLADTPSDAPDPCPTVGPLEDYSTCDPKCPPPATDAIPASLTCKGCREPPDSYPWTPNWRPEGLVKGLWIRTPEKPGSVLSNACVGCSEKGVYGVTLGVDLTKAVALKGKRLRVTVGPPWFIQRSNCFITTDGKPPSSACRIMEPFEFVTVGLVTKDPDAPARNAHIEIVPEGTACP